jgi:polyhydroxyalkanoate synthesis regulator phasin
MEEVFNPEKMAQMVWNLAKDYNTTTIQMMKTSAEQYDKTMDTIVKQGLVAQAEGQKLLSDWTNRAKQAQQQYWNLMDENMNKMETFFSAKGGSASGGNPDGQKRATK